MTPDSGGQVDLRYLQKQNKSLLAENERLKSSGGGGTSDGMDGRVSRLEGRVDKLGDDVSAIKVSLATLTERVAHLPSKGFILTALCGGVGFLSAVFLLAERIKHFFS